MSTEDKEDVKKLIEERERKKVGKIFYVGGMLLFFLAIITINYTGWFSLVFLILGHGICMHGKKIIYPNSWRNPQSGNEGGGCGGGE